MKKFVNILTLIIMVSVNFMTPFAYAQTDTQEVDFFQETENFDENNEENSDEIKTSDASSEDDENAEIEDSEDMDNYPEASSDNLSSEPSLF
jgi:cytoskeletal protein RodZ